MSVTLRIKKGTTEQWTTSGRILDNGELGIEIKENGDRILKCGDGRSKFNDLPVATYFQYATLLTNNLLATQSGTALDATQGRVLNEKIDQSVSWCLVDMATGTGDIYLDGLDETTCNEINIIVKASFDVGDRTYVTTIPYAELAESDLDRITVGGYYNSPTDYSYAQVFANKTRIKLFSFVHAGKTNTDIAQVKVYFR